MKYKNGENQTQNNYTQLKKCFDNISGRRGRVFESRHSD